MSLSGLKWTIKLATNNGRPRGRIRVQIPGRTKTQGLSLRRKCCLCNSTCKCYHTALVWEIKDPTHRSQKSSTRGTYWILQLTLAFEGYFYFFKIHFPSRLIRFSFEKKNVFIRIFIYDKIKEFYEKHLKGQNELEIMIMIFETWSFQF